MSNDRFEKLINQCKSPGPYANSFSPNTELIQPDVDSRLDAVSKLQAEFETGVEVGI